MKVIPYIAAGSDVFSVAQMTNSILVLLSTAIAAAFALCVGHVFGYREDLACALGGLSGLILSNITFRNSRSKTEPFQVNTAWTKYTITAYSATFVLIFGFIGWLTGYLHDHGAKAGALSGSLGGGILAILVPMIRRERLLGNMIPVLVVTMSIMIALLGTVVWIMYFTEMQYWYEFS